jgi:hypothetical protein
MGALENATRFFVVVRDAYSGKCISMIASAPQF